MGHSKETFALSSLALCLEYFDFLSPVAGLAILLVRLIPDYACVARFRISYFASVDSSEE